VKKEATTLIVYGSLRKNGYYHKPWDFDKLNYLGVGKVKGSLYILTDTNIPGVLPANNQTIVGEVYEFPTVLLSLLDVFETGYTRKETNVEMEDGNEIIAEMYYYNNELYGEVEEENLIEGGDYIKWIKNNGLCKE
jgi:gamma-glutamylcyclotransferase (GGCT)/AIG2-like uncharacterized protein YtfP